MNRLLRLLLVTFSVSFFGFSLIAQELSTDFSSSVDKKSEMKTEAPSKPGSRTQHDSVSMTARVSYGGKADITADVNILAIGETYALSSVDRKCIVNEKFAQASQTFKPGESKEYQVGPSVFTFAEVNNPDKKSRQSKVRSGVTYYGWAVEIVKDGKVIGRTTSSEILDKKYEAKLVEEH